MKQHVRIQRWAFKADKKNNYVHNSKLTNGFYDNKKQQQIELFPGQIIITFFFVLIKVWKEIYVCILTRIPVAIGDIIVKMVTIEKYLII